MGFIQIKNKLILFTCFVVWFICVAFADREIPSLAEDTNEYGQFVKEIRTTFAVQMEEEWNLHCCGVGGTMDEKVEEIALSFSANRRASVDEARAIIVLATERLLKEINNHEKIRPYLHEYPFPPGRAKLSISFYDSLNLLHTNESVMRVFHVGSSATTSSRNHLVYYARDAFLDHSECIFKEPYDDALKIVKAASLKEPLPHQATELETSTDEVFATFEKKMEEKCECILDGIGGKMKNSLEEIRVKFTIFHPATQEIAREIEVFATESLLALVNENEKLRPYLEEYPFPSSRIKMRLEFRDKHYFYFKDPTLVESAIIENDKIAYTQITPGDRDIILLEEEPYEKALRIVEHHPRSRLFKDKLSLWQKLLNFMLPSHPKPLET